MFLTLVPVYVHVRVCTSVLLSIHISGVHFANNFVFTNIQISAKPESKLVLRETVTVHMLCINTFCLYFFIVSLFCVLFCTKIACDYFLLVVDHLKRYISLLQNCRPSASPVKPALHRVPAALSPGVKCLGVKLIIYLHLVLTLRRRGVTPRFYSYVCWLAQGLHILTLHYYYHHHHLCLCCLFFRCFCVFVLLWWL